MPDETEESASHHVIIIILILGAGVWKHDGIRPRNVAASLGPMLNIQDTHYIFANLLQDIELDEKT